MVFMVEINKHFICVANIHFTSLLLYNNVNTISIHMGFSVVVKLNFRPYFRRYTSPTENLSQLSPKLLSYFRVFAVSVCFEIITAFEIALLFMVVVKLSEMHNFMVIKIAIRDACFHGMSIVIRNA